MWHPRVFYLSQFRCNKTYYDTIRKLMNTTTFYYGTTTFYYYYQGLLKEWVRRYFDLTLGIEEGSNEI